MICIDQFDNPRQLKNVILRMCTNIKKKLFVIPFLLLLKSKLLICHCHPDHVQVKNLINYLSSTNMVNKTIGIFSFNINYIIQYAQDCTGVKANMVNLEII